MTKERRNKKRNNYGRKAEHMKHGREQKRAGGAFARDAFRSKRDFDEIHTNRGPPARFFGFLNFMFRALCAAACARECPNLLVRRSKLTNCLREVEGPVSEGLIERHLIRLETPKRLVADAFLRGEAHAPVVNGGLDPPTRHVQYVTRQEGHPTRME